jgi:hypothetical protein
MMSVRRLSTIFALMALTFGFSLSVKAQEDCLYGFKIYVRDETGNRIENAKLEASGLTERDELPDYVKPHLVEGGAYMMASDAGVTVKGNFVLRVSAEGFDTYERRFNFPVCEYQRFELRLRPQGSTAKADFERLFNLHGKVFDEGMKPFGDAKVEAKSAEGRVYQTSSNAYGFYEIDLPGGAAHIRITNSRIPDVIFENFKIEKDKSVLNVPVCLKCKQGESKN